jgi:hypothetical protein
MLGFKYQIQKNKLTITGFFSRAEKLSRACNRYSGNVKEILIPAKIDNKSVTAIGYSAFSCVTSTNNDKLFNNLTHVQIPTSVIYIHRWAFESNELTNIELPNSITYIGSYAFQDNDLSTIQIPDSVTFIGTGAFAANRLTNIVIPEKFKTEEQIHDIFKFSLDGVISSQPRLY